MHKKLKNYLRKQKDAFTLIELIVVLVILGIILAITVPAVTSYIDDAKDATDDINISVLNKSTQAYKVYLYNELGQVPTDAFHDLITDDERQQRLLQRNLLDEILVSTRGATYTWDIPSQKWTKNGESGGGEDTTARDNATILGDPSKGNNRGEWIKGQYKYGDIVVIGGIQYKCVYSKIPGYTVGSTTGTEPYWKKIELEFDINNTYETNDIILYNNKYYKATGFDTGYDFQNYRRAAGSYSEAEIIQKLFTQVIWKDGAFIESTR